jgi:hypothetical protein
VRAIIRIYTDPTHYTRQYRPYLADLLRPFINQRTTEQNRAIYGTVVDHYSLIPLPAEADWAVLPLAWNYYHHTRRISQAREFIARAREHGKPVLTWVSGDFGARIPVKDVWVFGAAGNKSRAGARRFGMPVFIRDPLPELGLTDITLHTKKKKPLIGFCGYASASPIKSAGIALRTILRNILSALSLISDEPQDVYPAALLRQKILHRLQESLLVETDFIQRSQYKAGARTVEEGRSAREEFLQNMQNTDYTVCVRGGGNFSVRLYETLAMGRIPVLVDTDCLLPFSDDPRWRECCVYIERHEIPAIAEKIQSFHDSLSAGAFLELQHMARRFWEERLSFTGYFQHFPELF